MYGFAEFSSLELPFQLEVVKLLQKYFVLLIDPQLLLLLLSVPTSLNLFDLRQFYSLSGYLIQPPQTILVLDISWKQHHFYFFALALVAVQFASDVVFIDLVGGLAMAELHIF